MGYQLDLAARMRRTGLPVIEINGWQTRGSSTFNPRGSVNHDTVGARAGNAPSLGIVIGGRSDLTGPLYNVLIGRDLTLYVVAAGRANHAGDGGWRGLAGNSAVWGVALENQGTDAEPITDAEWDASAKVHAELARDSFPVSMTCQHHQWAPTRKVDAWRADPGLFAAAQQHYLDHPPGTTPPVVVPPQEEPMKASYIAVRDDPNVYVGGLALAPRPVHLFTVSDAVAAHDGIEIVAPPAGAETRPNGDSAGTVKTVWVIDPADKALFGLA